MKPRLLIVDDQEEIRTQMKWALAEDYEISLAGDRPEAMAIMEESRPPVVLLDLGLPPHPGDTVEGSLALGEILSREPLTKVIVITGQGERDNAVRIVGEGAYDFLSKPIETEELKIILKRAFYLATLERESLAMREQVGDEGFEGMLGTSPQMQQVFTAIRKVATTDAPVLLLGESGTGKEMAALAVHRRSSRKDGPFVAINCSAIPETLLESELFGHEKGSFTGAHVQRKGRIEMAARGTLFLDEIGELPSAIQVKLLRFLQEQRIERVGGRGEIEIDTRVIAATNVDLNQAMAEGRFREDLYYRLAVVVIRLPSLKERAGDVLFLAKAFLRKFSHEGKRQISGFGKQALQTISQYDWPGNVREMENRIRRAAIMAEGKQISVADLDLASVAVASGLQGQNLKEARERLERDMIERSLHRRKGKITAVAEELGISRPTLYELIEKLGIKRECS
jgi:two-component system NtrC family response regulator